MIAAHHEVRQRIGLLEALDGILAAIGDTSAVEFDAGEQQLLDLRVSARNARRSPVAFAHALPKDVLLVGLQAMRAMLEGPQ